MAKRLFTYQEYLSLFNTKIQPENYGWFPIFEFLMIESPQHHQAFILSRNPDEKDYFALLDELPTNPITPFFFEDIGFKLPINELKRHSFLVARSGSGKSEILKSLFYQLQKYSRQDNSCSLILIDPHSDLAKEVYEFYFNGVDKNRCIYIDPYYDPENTPVINPLDIPVRDEQNIDIMSQEISRAFQELLGQSSLSLQMETILIPCLATLLRKGNSNLKELQRFMDDDHNKDLIELGMQSPHPSHREFFKSAFKNSATYRTSKQSIYTKIQSLLNSQTFYNLTQGKSTFDLEKAMNEGKVIIFNLAQAAMGTDTSIAYGKLIVSLIQGMTLKRLSQEKHLRKPTFMFIDECQNYLSPSIEKILAESRKYGLFVVLANQNLAQIDDKKLKETILSNTNVKLAGANSPTTLKAMAQEIGVTLEALQAMKEYHFYAKVGATAPFMLKSPSFLFKHKSKFTLNEEEKQGLKAYQLSRYYQKKATLIASEAFSKPRETNEEVGENDSTSSHQEEASLTESPKPKYNFRTDKP